LLLEEFLVVNDSHDWRSGNCSNLDEVHAKAPCEVESVIDAKNAELLSVVTDYADLAGRNFVIFAYHDRPRQLMRFS
jgi:hypothetical protein